MLLSAVSFLFLAQSSSEVPEGLMNNPVFPCDFLKRNVNPGRFRTVSQTDVNTNCLSRERPKVFLLLLW